MLIAYAGKEPHPDHHRYDRAYKHFKLGRDTAAIAEMMRITEATALRYITNGRCIERNLPIPYERKE
ncbi:hypothetical protein [Mesorhizobium sp. M4B.F.Ca.ET.143.01.1.1]|uniref:hypothetical protein n=1 Tax=Mesorhizobium sp. M4B.F.Ca.ET.143.01.1.1 TaxID=2563947 RepID=UPI0010939DE7|nr:hypothetical protein [Mesorhizobium sp. M4B.F.Ca.ET.143.01.1.1]TGV26347.1 hypothetical protein EN786_12560 [Mesorhizobium sp. M4B.F.Ca.ET.143.01.1.1]